MRKIILLIIFILSVSLTMVSSCKKEESKNKGSFTIQRYKPEKDKPPKLKPGEFNELHFTPPTGEETIEVEKKSFSDPKKNEILIYKKTSVKKELLFTILPETNFYYIRKNKGNIYFTMEDADIYNDPQNDLWEVDVRKGVIKNTHIRIGRNFEFSTDGNYLCYIYNDYEHNKKEINLKLRYYIVYLLNLKSGTLHKYDFYKSFPLTQESPSCEIKALTDRFVITYFADGGGITLRGYILLSNKKFYPTEK